MANGKAGVSQDTIHYVLIPKNACGGAKPAKCQRAWQGNQVFSIWSFNLGLADPHRSYCPTFPGLQLMVVGTHTHQSNFQYPFVPFLPLAVQESTPLCDHEVHHCIDCCFVPVNAQYSSLAP